MTDAALHRDLIYVLKACHAKPVITILGRGGLSTSLTGADLLARARAMQDVWDQHLGAGPQVIMAALPAGEHFLVALIAALLGGGTMVPVAPPRTGEVPERLARMARNCGVSLVLCTTRNRAAVSQQLTDANGTLSCSVLTVDAPETALRVESDLPRTGPVFPIIQHTSGSTRFPKSVPVSAAQIRANCHLIQSLWGMNSDTVMVNWLPHYHDMGLMGCILYPLLSGAHSVQMSPFDMIRRPLSWLEAISDWRGTISGGPTFAFMECLNRIKPDDCIGLDLRSWQRAFCGAEPIPAGFLQRFSEHFAPHGLSRDSVFACYGMAECTLFAAGEPDHRDTPTVAQAGMPVEGCRLSATTREGLRISNLTDGARQVDGSPGEVWLAGPSVCQGYLGDPEAEDETFQIDTDGRRWMRTGDIGVIRDGHLFITGRLKDIVIVNGRNIAAAEIEWIAAQEDQDLNPSAAAAFAGGATSGARAHLLIETRTRTAAPKDPIALAARIRASVIGRCGVELDEIHILPRGSLPRTSSGKIRRQAVAQTFLDGLAHAIGKMNA